ncbi:hypothetical protein Tco_0996025, partial [Tanacetum coccineum]
MIPLSDHASHWSNYLGELIREMPLYYLSWQKVPAKRKAAIVTKIETQFDLKPHMQSQTYNVESIRQRRPENITLADWDAQLTFWNDPRNQARAAQNRQNRSKSTVMESSSTLRVPIADPHLLHDIHCWRGSNTEMGVPYTEEEIMAIVQTGKQQGHLSGVGRVLPGRATNGCPPPPQSTIDPVDVEKLKKNCSSPVGEQFGPPAPKTAKQLIAKRNQERVKSILLLVIPNEYLLKFHNVPDAKSLGAAIKLRFRGNDESKKMQRNVLKHQFENFTTTPNESLDKAYDRFQKIISQLKVHAAPISKEDINQKVYEDEMKRSLSSTSNSQNLAFLSSENTSSTNEVSTASGNFGVNTAGGTSSTSQVSSTPGADEVVCSFFAQQIMSPPLDNEDLQQIDQDDLKELDIRWQVAMLTVRVQRFMQKTRRSLDFKGKHHVTFDKSNVECYNYHR